MVGCGGGSVQVWNLEQNRIQATFPGHKTATECVEFHPYGAFFATGSFDTNMKIWDMKQKQCLQTYKGHTKGVTHVRSIFPVSVFF